jgi:hypothetical protein
MHIASAHLAELSLDNRNPRSTTAKSQKDAMRKMLEEQRDKLLKLAESIVTQKGLSPLDRILVLEKKAGDSNYITLEGNRRVAALKILDNPDLMDGASVSKAFKDRIDDLSIKFKKSSVEPIDVAVVKTRAESKYWINLRHTGSNGGAGVVPWHATQQERFQGPSPQLDILDFVRTFGKLSPYELSKLEGRFITTLRRLVDSPDARLLIGIDKTGQSIYSLFPAIEIMKPLRKMVLDLALKNISVSDLKTVDQMKTYVSSFSTAELPNPTLKGKPTALTAFTASDFIVATPPAPLGPTPTPPPGPKPAQAAKRHGIVPSGIHLTVISPRISAIYVELTRLKYSQHINAIAVLFRVFFETSIDHYMTNNGMSTRYPNKKFKPLIAKAQEVIDYLVANGEDQKIFNPIKFALTDQKSPLWVDLLHSYIHNMNGTPTAANMSAAWDHAFPMLKAIWK